jgi:hypothetical protein
MVDEVFREEHIKPIKFHGVHATLRAIEQGVPFDIAAESNHIDTEAFDECTQEAHDLFAQDYKAALSLVESNNEEGILYSTVIKRINSEVTIQTETGQIGFFEDIDIGLYDNSDETASRNLRREINVDPNLGSLGEYASYNKRITVREERPDEISIIKSLLTTGSLPQSLQTRRHEATHGFQDIDNILTIRTLLPVMLNSRSKEMKETHAFFTADSGSALSLFHIQDVLPHKDGYALDPQRIAFSLSALPKLDALGFSPQQIGSFIALGDRWNRKLEIFPRIQGIIESKMKSLGLTPDNLKELVYLTEDERHSAKKFIQHIVAGELLKYLDLKDKGDRFKRFKDIFSV